MQELQDELDNIQEQPDIQSIQTDLDNINKQMQEMVQTYKDKVREKFHAGLKAVFQQYPEVKMIVWGQGTPGFCDGEPCYFSVYEPTIQIGDKFYGEVEYGIEVDDEELDYNDLIYVSCVDQETIDKSNYLKQDSLCTDPNHILYNKIRDLIGSMDDVFEDMFDGDALVTITPDGIQHDWYDVGY